MTATADRSTIRLPGPDHVRELYFRLLHQGASMEQPLRAEGRRVSFVYLDEGPEGSVEVIWEGS